MGKITNLEQLAQTARAAKTFTSGLVGELAEAADRDIAAAKSAADAAKSAAQTAQSTANEAKGAAGTAQSTADTAKTAAQTAQSTADTAKTAAQTAQSTADTAKTAAQTAQSTADTAQTAAQTAQSTADTAQTAAQTAQNTANAAKTAAVVMKGASASAAGAAGLAPAPAAGAQGKYLRGDGTWQTPPDTNTTYSAATQSAAGLMSAADKKKLDGVATSANAYTHPTTSGNKHIPSGGSSGQILRWSADGTAAWGADNNTTYSAATQSANGLMSAADKKKLDGIAAGANVNTVTGVKGNAESSYRTGQINLTPANLGAAPIASPVFTGSISLGRKSGTIIGMNSFAEGDEVEATGSESHAEGRFTKASGHYSHAEGGNNEASGSYSHTEGMNTEATGAESHAEGIGAKAYGDHSHAEGMYSKATAAYSHAEGYYTIADIPGMHASGECNKNGGENDLFIIGNGSGTNKRSNCFRVTKSGIYGVSAFNSTGADYAELMEWADENPDAEDRCGKFVTIVGDKIKIASPADTLIMGIISGNPSVVGDVHDDQWMGMYLTDVFGRPLWEDVEVPDETVEEPDPENPEKAITRVIIPAHTEHRQKLNPNYDNSQPYEPRTKRKEWDAVGMLGKLVAVDDGTCTAGGYCTVGEGGIATASATQTKYYVMKRIDETHVHVLIL